jgi:dipeptidyl aminopeptidase/acylaminoacyl peptidase
MKIKLNKLLFLCTMGIFLTPTFASAQAPLTLNQIMADPDWIARSPNGLIWSADSSQFYFEQKRLGNNIKDLYKIDVANQTQVEVAPTETLLLESFQGAKSADGKQSVFSYQGDIFIAEEDNKIIRLTKTEAKESNAMFLNDGRVAYQLGDDYFTVDLETNFHEQLVSLNIGSNKSHQPKEDFLTEQQKRLFKIVQKREREKSLKKEQAQQTKEALALGEIPSVYFEKAERISQTSLSPNGRYLIVTTSQEGFEGINDSMPEWVNKSGYVNPKTVRVHVGNADPQREELWLIDIESGEKTELSKSKLPRITDDVLADIKKENYKAKGKKYRSPKRKDRTERATYVYQWAGANGGIQWSDSGDNVAINLFADDNKDRWIVGVDFKKKKLKLHHHHQDEAWVNKSDFHEYGFIPQSENLYFLSEKSGYAHLYIKKQSAKRPVQITSGQYIVNNLTPSKDGLSMYLKANKEHPGEYEIFRVNLKNKNMEQLTQLDGMTDYALSPDEQTLMLSHSKLLQPTELYMQANQVGAQAQRLTQTIESGFSEIKWNAPDIVAVPSTHFKGEVYSRLYRPAEESKAKASKESGAPAVIFVHGAGYLQNAHKGWSGYFREFMFHNLLAQQGVTVLDMDYRASKGYGRDHRTAIYRQMGKPELEDFKDGIAYLVEQEGIDPKRVGIYGGSYGGFMTFMALFKEPELFAAGAALRPVTDWAHYNHWYTSPILNNPQDDEIAYNRSSPIEFAEGLTKPLLICHGMVDDNVFYKDSVRLVQRLIELEKENFELAAYPIEPHGFKEPSSWLDEYRRIYKLFKQHVM